MQKNKTEKAENDKPVKHVKDGILVYSYSNLHHLKSTVRGYLYKQGNKKLFLKKLYYKRYFIMTDKKNYLTI